MNPRPITDADLVYWSELSPVPAIYAADDPTCMPCPAIRTTVDDPYGVLGTTVIRVPYELSEIELMHLAKGGTLWLSCWGGLPAHMLEVQEPCQR